MKRALRMFCVCSCVLLGTDSASAQGETGVTAQGKAVLTRQPDILRVEVDMLAKGSDLKSALAKLKERRQAAAIQLEKLGAVKGSVSFGEPGLGSEKIDRQKQMETMVRQRLGKQADKIKIPEQTIASQTLRFELPLKAAETEEVLLAFQTLKQQIKEADFAGLKEYAKAAPQEEELADEIRAMEMQQGGEVKLGEPTYLFVKKISEQEFAKALAEAYAKAHKDAFLLAQAAGNELGALRHLADQGGVGQEDARWGYQDPYYQRAQARPPAVNSLEAVALVPGPVTYRVTIHVAFHLKATGK